MKVIAEILNLYPHRVYTWSHSTIYFLLNHVRKIYVFGKHLTYKSSLGPHLPPTRNWTGLRVRAVSRLRAQLESRKTLNAASCRVKFTPSFEITAWRHHVMYLNAIV